MSGAIQRNSAHGDKFGVYVGRLHTTIEGDCNPNSYVHPIPNAYDATVVVRIRIPLIK
jgi:hypothetical protein